MIAEATTDDGLRKQDDLATGMMASGGWFPFHLALIKQLGIEAAGVLQYLINFHGRIKRSKSYQWNEGWFFATAQQLEDELGMSGKVQRRLIDTLVETGYVKTKVAGLPARRHFKINARKVIETVGQWQNHQANDNLPEDDTNELSGSTQSVTPSCAHLGKTGITRAGTHSNTALSNKASAIGSLSGKGPGPAPAAKFPITEFHERLAGELRAGLVEHDADIVNPPAPRRGVGTKKLAEVLFRVEAERKAPREEIEAVVRWLVGHYGDDYVPALHKAEDLRDRWRAFVEAKKRWESDRGREDGQIDNNEDPAKRLDEATRKLARDCLSAWETVFGMGRGIPSKSEVEEWLKDNSYSADRITREDVRAVL